MALSPPVLDADRACQGLQPLRAGGGGVYEERIKMTKDQKSPRSKGEDERS